MDSSEEDIPIIKIHLKTYWYLVILSSLTVMIVWVFSSFVGNLGFWVNIFLGSVVTITFIIGLLVRNVELIFKIDNADNILIYERYWSKLRIYRRSFKLQDIKRFNVFTLNIPNSGGGDFIAGEYNFLALEFISQKPKYLSSARDSPFTVDYAQQLNSFLKSFTSLNRIYLNRRIIPSKHPSAEKFEKNYRKVCIILMFIVSFFFILIMLVAFFWN